MVAAPGPSLNAKVAETLRNTDWPVLVCQDAWRLLPWADKLYGCDDRWWHAHKGTAFGGEKWSSHGDAQNNDKRDIAEKYNVNLVRGVSANDKGFSTNPEFLHYGDNSGYQAINLAILLGSPYIVLVGFNMSRPGGKGHFFGDHPAGLTNQEEYERWVPQFARAAAELTDTVIVNATPDSALTCFPTMRLEDALANYYLYRHGSKLDPRAGRDSAGDGAYPLRLQ